MEKITELLGNIDFEQIIETVKGLVAKLQESGILDKIVDFVKGLFA